MSQALGVLDVTFEAGEDLSDKQYSFVYLSADNTVSACTTGHLDAIGVLQNKPVAGEAAVVRVLGLSKVVSGGTIAVNNRVVSDTDGKAAAEATPSDTEQKILGVAVEGAATGDIFEILLTHESLVKGTA